MGMFTCKEGDVPVSGLVLGTFPVSYVSGGLNVKKHSKWTMKLTQDAFVFAGIDPSRAYIPHEHIISFEVKPRSLVTNSVITTIQGYKTVLDFTFIGNTEQLEIVRFQVFAGIGTGFKENQMCEQLVHIMKANGIFDKFKKTNATTTPVQDDILGQIEKLAELHKAGILTDEEFQTKKAELLKKI